jgi:hypothetical protein
MSQQSPFRRVTAVFHSGSHGMDLLGPATEIAARLHAEVHGLLLADANLHRLAEQGIARVVSRFAPFEAVESAGQMFEHWPGQLQAALAEAARIAGIAWSFQTVSDDPETLTQSVGEEELLVLTAGDDWLRRDIQVTDQVRRVGEARMASILLVRRRLRRIFPTVVVAEPSAAAEHALALGAALAVDGPHARRLNVLVGGMAGNESLTPAWVRRRYNANITMIPDLSVDAVAAALRKDDSGVLLIPSDLSGLRGLDQAATLADATDCAILLLR